MKSLNMRKTHQVKVGRLGIGGRNPVRVQSMTNTKTSNIFATLKQVRKLEDAGCELVRVSVRDMQDATAIKRIKKAAKIPLIADVHFDWRLAVASLENGADKVRVNPGNLGGLGNFERVVDEAKKRGAAIRIGVNAGSLKSVRKSSKRLNWSKGRWAEGMASEAFEYVSFCAKKKFKKVIVSLKADDIERTLLANKIFSSRSRFPLHVGITEAGPLLPGLVKSSVGLAELLKNGMGDTLRVSLTADPVLEVRAAYEILKVLKLRSFGPEIISCPTCGRCQVNVERIVGELEEAIYCNAELLRKSRGLKIAVMGCVVNGPGEAKEADFGIAGGKGSGAYFEKGKRIKIIPEKDWLRSIIERILKHTPCRKLDFGGTE